MKLFSVAALLAAFSLPLAASAQQVQQPYPPYSAQQQPGQNHAQHVYKRWYKLLTQLNLSGQQQQQIQNVLDQFVAQHQPGAPRDPQAARNLKSQIFALLTPQQQQQLQQEMYQQKQERLQRQLQHMQQQGYQGQQQQPPRR